MSGEEYTTDVTWTSYECKVGPLTVLSGPGGVRRVAFPGGPRPPEGAVEVAMPEITGQLDAYFGGERRDFDLALDLRGDPLQLLVCEQLLEIPYGGTISYGEMARRVDSSAYPAGTEPYMRPRIVGAALGRNQIPVIVPCHRVIGSDGSLVGFGGGLERKRLLLELEGVDLGRQRPASDDAPQLNLL